MAADYNNDNTVRDYSDSDSDLTFTGISIKFAPTVFNFEQGSGGGSTRPTTGMIYPRGT